MAAALKFLKCRGLLQNYNLLRGRDINDPMLMFIFAEHIKDVFFFGVRIPRSSGHPFHEHLTTDSTLIRPPIPRASG
ncbi:hypothetical protein, partial [Pseudomonas paracarnis]|uniref:hypothetical protein n=1 Tax=Pseudomonas paracarnis TaxID=2750625 RepID=UPI00249C701C